MGAFSFLTERLGENPLVRQICRSKFGRPKAGPVARSAEGTWMHLAIPLSAIDANKPKELRVFSCMPVLISDPVNTLVCDHFRA